MQKIVVFDLDGTLVDSLADIHFALNKALAAYQMPEHSLESVRGMVGHGLGELVQAALPKGSKTSDLFSQELHTKVLLSMRSIYNENPFRLTQPYAGIPELVDDLKSAGTTLAVLTNKAEAIATTIVEHFFPGRFTIVQGENSELPRKPHPDALRGLLAKFLTIATDDQDLSQNTVLIGDSEADIQTGLAAHVRAIGVTWGFRTAVELRNAGAQEVVSTTEQLRGILIQN